MLYFVRHGQTNHNVNKLLAGRCDIPLNDEGVMQARDSALNFKDIKIDLIFCSPLIRAKQTCKEINKYHEVEVIIDDRLMERDFGVYESKPYECVDGKKCWNYYCDMYDKEIEPLKDVFTRVDSLVNDIKKEYFGKNILIVAHNDIGRALYCHFNGVPQNGDLLSLTFTNADIIKYEWGNLDDKNSNTKI